MDDLRDEFIAETRETLETLAIQLISWEKTPSDLSLIDSVFRFVHTVKGSCGFLDLPRLEKLSHAAEDLLSAARDSRLTVSDALVSAVLAVIDRISELTEALETGASVHDNDSTLIETMLQFHPDHVVTDSGVTEIIRSDEAGSADILALEPVLGKSRTVRVSLQQLDKLMNGVSDLVLARNELSRQLRSHGMTSDLDQAFSRLSGSVAEIRDSISLVRMQPIDRLFSTIPRLLRDMCIELEKDIEFSIEGGDVEIDREMVESLRDPLTHIIRNAADHGIEAPADRIANGKPASGRIHINARQAGNQIVLEIKDDGRGINVERLRQTVLSRKLMTQQQWQSLDEDARLATIFAPGLSTAETVTAISGRGVGMDVVRTNLEAVGATIHLKNEEGQGFTISLLLPLTLSIIAGLSVKAGGQLFALSRTSILEILSTTNAQVEIEDIGGAKMAKVRGKRYIYAKLEDLLDLETQATGWSARTLIIIRPANGAIFALDVEAVIDTEELVVKPCAPLIMATGLYAGTTLPDNGKPMLLLDASGLASTIGSIEGNIAFHNLEKEAVEPVVETEGSISVLLFETMDGRRRALPLSIVDRMEDVPSSQIYKISDYLVVNVDGKSFELLEEVRNPEDTMIKMLRISDGQITKYMAIGDVIDIFTVVPDRTLSVASDSCDAIIHIESEPIELLSAYALFVGRYGQAAMKASKSVCFLEKGDGWETNILAPLLLAAGYSVSFDEADRETAAVILKNDGTGDDSVDPRNIILRESLQSVSAIDHGSVYRYDREALLSEIETRIAGRA